MAPMRLVFDMEANGLLLDATRIWCLVAKDIDTEEQWVFREHEIPEAYRLLLSADRVIAHNGRMYDCPVLDRVCGGGALCGPGASSAGLSLRVFDTLLVSRLVYPDAKSNPVGGHSIGDWGRHLGLTKEHEDISDWSRFTEDMLERCVSDVQINAAVYRELLPKAKQYPEAVRLEHRVATIIAQQILNGFPIKHEALEQLEQAVLLAKAAALDELGRVPPWVHEAPLKTPAYWQSPVSGQRYETKAQAPTAVRSSLIAGHPKVKQVVTPFNPGSRDHIARLFREKYGWKPKLLTETGKAVVDAKVMETLDYPEAQAIHRTLLCDKRLSQIKQWRTYQRGGRIHGDVITNGAVSGRMTHSRPNMAQIPQRKKPWGKECRACFGPREGWRQVGADASGLELRMLAHYMFPWDQGAYGEKVLEADIHAVNKEAAGLDDREQAKTFIYAFLYGAGDAQIGSVVGRGAARGKRLKEQFLSSLPALQSLLDQVKQTVKTDGYLVGLDGRHLPVRSEHMALNTLLQSAGAVVMKQALVHFYEDATALLGPHGQRWALMANVHDEFQTECEPDVAEALGKLAVAAIRKAGETWKLEVRLDGEYKVGNNWAECH